MKVVVSLPQLVLVALVGSVAGVVGYEVASGGGHDSDPASRGAEAIALQQEPAQGPRHLALNTTADDYERLVQLGYDVFDVGPDEGELDALPEGGQGMLWVGDFSCDEGFGVSFEELTSLVDELGDDPRVYGWYLVDEPDPGACPEVVDGIRQRADYIHEHAPDQVAFVSITDYEMGPLNPRSSHVDLLGLDPYPCRIEDGESCDLAVMDSFVQQARDAGITADVIAPVIQVFGQDCATELDQWRLPRESELGEILDRWSTLVPNPELEISYSWGRQEAWACPALVDADGTGGLPDLQSVVQEHNASAGTGSGSGPAGGGPDDPSSCPTTTTTATGTETTATTATTSDAGASDDPETAGH